MMELWDILDELTLQEEEVSKAKYVRLDELFEIIIGNGMRSKDYAELIKTTIELCK